MVIYGLISASFNIELKDFKLPVNGFKINPWNVIPGILISCIFTLFSGCATLPSQTKSDAVVTTIVTEPAANTQNGSAVDFNILGRISIQDEKQSFSGSFRWQHLATSDEILLFTPLGQAVAEITKDDEGVRLITSKLEAFYAADVESLTQEILGWRMPLNGLQYWIQGTHSPITSAEKDLDNKDRIVAIRQDGWHIHYNSFAPAQINSIPLPKVLNLVYQNLRIRLVVDDWKVE